MTIRNLDHAVRPRSVAVFGASKRDGSVGRVVMDNHRRRRIRRRDLAGQSEIPRGERAAPAFQRQRDIPGVPDLAVIVTPPQTVPGIIRELGEKGTRAAVVITAGLTRENGLRQAMLDAAKPYLFRIIGPNTLGLMIPPIKLNASFAHMAAKPGGIALLSQSGAIATSLIDWAADNNVGFSHIVSLGDMADVDVARLSRPAGGRREDARDRHVSRNHSQRAQVHVGGARRGARQAGDRHQVGPPRAGRESRRDAYRCAVGRRPGRRGGAAAAPACCASAASRSCSMPPRPWHGLRRCDRARVGIVTNGGGAGVLAVDQLDRQPASNWRSFRRPRSKLLNRSLPPTWSHANPVDIIGDASARALQGGGRGSRSAIPEPTRCWC